MVPHTRLTEVNVADVTVKWRNRYFTHVTTDDILSAVTGVHDFTTLSICKKGLKSEEEKGKKIEQWYIVWILYHHDIFIFDPNLLELFLRLILLSITSILILSMLK